VLNDAKGDFSSRFFVHSFDDSNPVAPIPQPPSNETAWYVPVYFPSTTDQHGASPIEVQPGATSGGIDITVAPVRKHRILGTVVDAGTGIMLNNAQIQRADNPPMMPANFTSSPCHPETTNSSPGKTSKTTHGRTPMLWKSTKAVEHRFRSSRGPNRR
jgi:hypothetical protein